MFSVSLSSRGTPLIARPNDLMPVGKHQKAERGSRMCSLVGAIEESLPCVTPRLTSCVTIGKAASPRGPGESIAIRGQARSRGLQDSLVEHHLGMQSLAASCHLSAPQQRIGRTVTLTWATEFLQPGRFQLL